MTALAGEGFNPSQELDQTPETFYEAIRAARNELYQVGFEDEFQTLCSERRLDPMNIEHPNDRTSLANEGAYAAAVSDYMHRKLDSERERTDYNGDRIVTEKALVARELAATTADYVFSQLRLSSLPKEPYQDPSQEEVRRRVIRSTVHLASHFNGLIRKTAAEFPEITPSQMTNSLTQIVNTRFQNPGLLHNAPDVIRSAVRGAKFESAHGQILKASGFEVRGTDVDEDVRKGADYVAIRDDNAIVRVNIKASTHKLRDMGIQARYGYDPKGVLIVSLLNERDIGDSFAISDELVAEKVPLMREAINSPTPEPRRARTA
jgi:hypothetical protein